MQRSLVDLYIHRIHDKRTAREERTVVVSPQESSLAVVASAPPAEAVLAALPRRPQQLGPGNSLAFRGLTQRFIAQNFSAGV
eukprot:COSAG04_NODE_2767_length_3616_cov_1.412568_5_plen_82_part_00